MVDGYDIIHTQEYDIECAKICGGYSEADDFVRDVHLIISRNPYKGLRKRKDVWEFELSGESIRISYTLNEKSKEVCLVGIKKF